MKTQQKDLQSLLAHYQSKLISYAYNIVGDSLEAEDLVQEVLNNYILRSDEHIKKPESYLVRATINKSINRKQLLRNQMEEYPGNWLPTPVSTEENIYEAIDRNRVINYSLLVLLERLTPKERAVFILKKSYEYSHEEIGDILNIKTENSRQLLKRGQQKLKDANISPTAFPAENSEMLEQLAQAILNNNIGKVKNLLSEGIKTTSDGGPKVSAARNVLIGHDRVIKLLQAIYGKYLPEGSTSQLATINHQPAIVYKYNGSIFRSIVFEISNSKITDIYIVVNPDKLKKLNSQLILSRY